MVLLLPSVQKKRDRLLLRPVPPVDFRFINYEADYNIPLVDSTFPANRSSNIVA